MTDWSVILENVPMAPRRSQSGRAKARVKERTGARAGTRRAAVPPQENRQAERRLAILEAALAEFSERGFSAARLDDVARRAGIAKGTIYLYFRDKETLFAELIRTRLVPLVGTLQHLRETDIPVRVLAERLIDLFVDELFATPRKDVIRLMIGEGARFPKLAEFYYREVLGPVMDTLGDLLRRAHQRGEIADDALARFPQLLAAPGVVAIVWNGLFDRFAPLDVRALMRAHVDLILGQGPQRGNRQ